MIVLLKDIDRRKIRGMLSQQDFVPVEPSPFDVSSRSPLQYSQSLIDSFLLLKYRTTAGPKGMLGSAIGCALLLGVFEGVGVLVGRLFAETNKPVTPQLPEAPPAPVQAPILMGA
jgi:hypothetical protein